jgi:carbon storage regulator
MRGLKKVAHMRNRGMLMRVGDQEGWAPTLSGRFENLPHSGEFSDIEIEEVAASMNRRSAGRERVVHHVRLVGQPNAALFCRRGVMLVLSGKVGNRIIIAGDIEITVLRVQGNRVRLGVNAPRHISIIRGDMREPDEQADPELQRCSAVLTDSNSL